MKGFEYPVIFDATHSVQEPGGLGMKSGGKREYIPVLSKAAIAVGVAGIFIETHDDPDNAPSDGPNMLNVKDLKSLILKLIELDNVSKS
jgi:2-dehydro-3-deoxyphosphooctonate aldolase (KDO 8-P synthase)